MYNPKSLKAEEFIDDAEVLATLKYAEENKHNRELIESILEKAAPKKTGRGTECAGLTHREASVLLACDIPEMTEKMYKLANDIKQAFGETVANLVSEESENKREGQDKTVTWRIRKEETILSIKDKTLEAKKIMLADKLSNLRASLRDYRVTGIKMWEKFNMTDPAQQKWYYTSVLGALSELCETPQYKEAMGIIQEIFAEVV